MNVDEDMLDWGGNEEEEGGQQQTKQGLDIAPKKPTATKDEATLSGAESLLALATWGASADHQDDKDSDVVSLGGGEDDMEELYAYQSRTHLGGTASGDTDPSIRAAPTPTLKKGAAPEEKMRENAPPSAASPTEGAPQPSKPSSNDATRRPHSKPNSQSKSQSNDYMRSPSTTRLPPPTGSLALPPKPVAAPTTPYVRPSHPSIMSASSMAPRERERDSQWDNRDSSKGKSGSHSHASPESDALPLAPGWEIRRSRGDSQEIYYYHTKTHQSTWSRSTAAGISSSNQEGSASPAYSRGRARQPAPSSGRVSPLGRDPPRSAGPDSGSQSQSRQSKPDLLKADLNAPSISTQLTFEERHYRPNGNRLSPRSPLHDNVERLQRPVEVGLGMPKRDPSPMSLPARPPRDKDRDRPVSRREQDRDRGPNDRVAPDRNGERNVERDRSRSPGRGRSSQNSKPGDAVSNTMERDVPGPSARDRRAPAAREASRPYGGLSPPLHRSAPQAPRLRPPEFEDRPRFPLPNHDQSSSRDRRRTPSPNERLHKRTRSPSPAFATVNRTQAIRYSQAQPRRDAKRWDDSDAAVPLAWQREGPYQPVPFGGRERDRPPHQLLGKPGPPAVKLQDSDKPRNGDGDGNRFSGRENERENDAKRRKMGDNSDSAVARRPPLDAPSDHDTGDSDVPRRKRLPLPPQSERFKEMALPRPPVNGVLPPGIPSGPRRAPPIRDTTQPDFAPPGRAAQPRFSEPKGGSLSDGKYDDTEKAKPKPRVRERERGVDLPTGPRAMEAEAEPSFVARRGYSPQRHWSPPRPAGNAHHQQEDLSEVNEPRRELGSDDWVRRANDRQIRGMETLENNYLWQPANPFPPASRFGPQHQPPPRPPFNATLSGANVVPVAPRKPGLRSPTGGPDLNQSRMGLPSRPQELPPRGGGQDRRMRGPNSPEGGFRPLSGNFEGQRRQSFSEAEFKNFVPRAAFRASASPFGPSKPLPDASRRSRLHLQPPYTSGGPLPPTRDRPIFPEDEDKQQAVWDREDRSASNSPVEVRGPAFSENPHVEYGITSPPPSSRRSQSATVSSSHVPEEHRSQSPRADHDELPSKGPALPSKSGEEHMDDPDSLAAGMHPDRARAFASSQPRGSRPSRFRRNSRQPEPVPNDHGPSHDPPQGPRPGSLLDRLSDPTQSSHPPSLPLKERMDVQGDSWKKTGEVRGPSLRERVEAVGDARQMPPRDTPRWDRTFSDDWSEKQGRRDRPRKRGRGQ